MNDPYCALAERDDDMYQILKTYGRPPAFTRDNTFITLVTIILEQQVSLASARQSLLMLEEATKGISIYSVLDLDDDAMRAAYVSRQKARYIRSLARDLIERRFVLTELSGLSDQEVHDQLIQCIGIGDWTIDVYLLMVLQRSDIFPIGDVALRTAMQHIKHVPHNTSRQHLLEIAEQWRPYRSYATRLLWHAYLSSSNLRRHIA